MISILINDIQRKDRREMKAKIGVMQPQGKEHLEPPAATRGEEGLIFL